jgi:hypothetical protein
MSEAGGLKLWPAFLRPRWRHKVRGSVYEEIGLASLQTARPVRDKTVLVVYQGSDGTLWARPKTEFQDGRFERLPSNAALLRKPGEWQAATMERLTALGYAGFIFGPGVNWWPMDADQRKVAGPFTSTEAFDAWLSAQEAR